MRVTDLTTDTPTRIVGADADGDLGDVSAMTTAIKIPTGTTVQRPGTPVTGEVRYNTTLGGLEWYGASAYESPVKSASTTGLTTAQYILYGDANGRATGTSGLTYNGTQVTAGGFIPSSSTVPANGMYLPEANMVGFASNSVGRMSISSSGRFMFGKTTSTNSKQFIIVSDSLNGWGLDANRGLTINQANNGTQAAKFNVVKSRGTFDAKLPLLDNDQVAVWDMLAYVGSTNTEQGVLRLQSNISGPVYDLASGQSNNSVFFLQKSYWTGSARGYSTFLYADTLNRIGIYNNSAPQRTLDVNGEVRVRDLTTDTPTRIVGADADGDLGAITVGSGLSLSAGTLTATGGVSDGDKGDITVSSSGTVWNIDADVIGTTELADGAVATANITNNNVTLAKIQTISTNMLLGNDIGSDAAPSQLVVGNGIQLSNSGVRLGGHRVTTTNTSATVTSEIDSCGQLVVVATLASGAGADLTITLPNAGSSYLGREVLIYADDKDDDSTGGVDYNVIVTTTSGTYLYYGNGESGLGLNASYEIDPPATPTYVKLICVLDSSLNYKWIVLSY